MAIGFLYSYADVNLKFLKRKAEFVGFDFEIQKLSEIELIVK
jgi:hypothetical protein